MSAPRWPAGRPTDVEVKVAAPAPAPVVVDDPEAAAEKLEPDLRAARAESVEAKDALAAAREALPGAAARGLEAVRASQRSIRDAEERLRLAEEVVGALEQVHRPLADAAYAKRRERRRVEMTGELGAAVAARDRIDVEVLAAIEVLRQVAERRQAATAAAVAIEKQAAAEGLAVGNVDAFLLPAPIREALRRVPLPFAS